TGDGQGLIVRREDYNTPAGAVTEGLQHLALRQVPQQGRALVAARGQAPAIVRQGDEADVLCLWADQGGLAPAGVQVPAQHPANLGSADALMGVSATQQRCAIRREVGALCLAPGAGELTQQPACI